MQARPSTSKIGCFSQSATFTVSPRVQTSVPAEPLRCAFLARCDDESLPVRRGPESAAFPGLLDLILDLHGRRCIDDDLGEHSSPHRRPSKEVSVLEEPGEQTPLLLHQDAPQGHGHLPHAASQDTVGLGVSQCVAQSRNLVRDIGNGQQPSREVLMRGAPCELRDGNGWHGSESWGASCVHYLSAGGSFTSAGGETASNWTRLDSTPRDRPAPTEGRPPGPGNHDSRRPSVARLLATCGWQARPSRTQNRARYVGPMMKSNSAITASRRPRSRADTRGRTA